jgi:cyclophilin family peptidyl-prolyl cis-trans isomerase
LGVYLENRRPMRFANSSVRVCRFGGRQVKVAPTTEGILMQRILYAAVLTTLVVSTALAADDKPVVVMETSLGTIKIELDPQKAPITVKNFLSYVDDKFYDGTIFHRVISNFMIQGGGFQPGMKQKETKAPIKNESGNGLKNVRGAIAMARTSDLNSATAQFYINTVDNLRLDDARYCVFGKVIEGMDVVDKIRRVETRNVGPHGDVPVQDVVIKSVRVAK